MLADVLSIAALVIALVSFAWQVATWRRSGPVIRVEVCQAMPTYGPGIGTELGDPHVCVTASNRGRSPITVKSWGLRLPDGRTMAVAGTAWSTSLPCRLEPGADASWYVLTASVRETSAAAGVRYQDLVGYVSLGDGTSVRAKRLGIGWK